MDFKNIIFKAEEFAKEFIGGITNTSPQKAQLYFMDNQEELKKYMDLLLKTADMAKHEDNDELIKEADMVTAELKKAISEFKEKIKVNPETTEESASTVLNNDTIKDAMSSNENTQALAEDLDKVISAPAWDYLVMVDGNPNLLSVSTKEELKEQVNLMAQLAKKEFKLYKLNYEEIPLKVQTVVTF